MLDLATLQRDLPAADPEARAELAEKVGRFLSADQARVEHKTAEDLARILANDATVKVRELLATEIRNCPFLSPDIAEKIARDVDEVAAPFLLCTEALTAEALEEIVYQCGAGAREAIALREGLPEKVSYAISEVGHEKAVCNLLGNMSAEISDRICYKVTERFPESKSLMERMAERPDLSLTVVEILVDRLSDGYKNKIVSAYGLGEDYASYIAGETKRKALANLLEDATGPEIEAYLKKQFEEGKLSVDLLLQTLKDSNIRAFKYALSLKSGISMDEIEQALADDVDDSFKNLLIKADIGEQLIQLFISTYKSGLAGQVSSAISIG